MRADTGQGRDMSQDDFINPDQRIFTLPPEYRPAKAVLHAAIPLAGGYEPVTICRVTPEGEVFKFKDATLEDIAIILIEHYHVNFMELAGTWELEDAGYEADDA